MQIAVDCLQLDADLLGLFEVLRQVRRQTAANVLNIVQDRPQRVVDLVGHAGGEASDREHLLRLHHHFFQRQTLGDVIDPDDHPASGTAHQRVEGQGVVAGFIVLDPGDALDFGHGVLFHCFLELWQERF